MDAESVFALVLAAAAVVAALWWPGAGILARLERRRADGRRALYEDILKHTLAWDRRGRTATPESVAGALGVAPRRILRAITRMQTRGLLQGGAEGLALTPSGERLALHVVRAHRLWERYLADEAGAPLGKLHQAAEKAEHLLTPEALDELEAHLGHPERDPHGDPIPTAEGALAEVEGVGLNAWPAGPPARILHIEDEPEVIFQQVLASGLRPGMSVRVLEDSPERLVVSDGANEISLAHAVAANIQVAAERARPSRPCEAIRLTELPGGVRAEVVELDEQCRGFSRRRLMDLGLTPSAEVEVALENTFGDPRAYRVRGAVIALRRAQAEHIWVRPSAEPAREAAA